MLEEVYPTMKNDNISAVAKSDHLIIVLGNQWLVRNVGNVLLRRYYTSAVMRICARLLIVLRSMTKPPTGTGMIDYLSPAFFHHVARAALKVRSQDDTDAENLQAPSSSLKLSYDLKHLCDIKVATGIKTGDTQMRTEGDDFLMLLKIEWSTKLERELLEQRKADKKRPMPLPSDVQKLAAFYRTQSEEMDLEDWSYNNNFRRVSVIALGSLIVYNRHRPGGFKQ